MTAQPVWIAPERSLHTDESGAGIAAAAQYIY
jgi:hypothetical protein